MPFLPNFVDLMHPFLDKSMSCNEFIYLLIRAMIVHNIFKKHNCFNINDKKKSTNQHFRMISEGSSDTEDWSNAAENSDFC